MKRVLLVLALVLITCVDAHAQARGALQNVWASWANVSNSIATTFTLPYNTRDVQIINSSSNPICVDLRGNALGSDAGLCRNSFATRFYLDGGDSMQLYDYVTSGITVWGLGAAASPVSVVVTY